MRRLLFVGFFAVAAGVLLIQVQQLHRFNSAMRVLDESDILAPMSSVDVEACAMRWDKENESWIFPCSQPEGAGK